MKNFKTRLIKNPGYKAKLFTDYGIFYLHLSNTIRNEFTIGDITFQAIGGYPSNGFRPDKPIPESWTIDLSQSVAD
jgi:hypothetical protein